MKKFILICLLTFFVLGTAQEKKISFAKVFNYQMIDKKAPLLTLKMFASNNNEFLTRLNIKDVPMYYYTDALGTTAVSLEMNSRLAGSGLSALMYLGYNSYGGYGEKEEYTLEAKKLDTKETILGIPCSHYMINYRSKDGTKKENEDLKLCIDDRSSINNMFVFSGLLNQYLPGIKMKSSGLSGLILKAGPEKTYDKEYFILESIKDSKDQVFFDHKKAMTDQQRKQDSIMIAYKKQEEEYAKNDSVYAATDATAVVADSAATAAIDPYSDQTYYYIPDYTSEYKKAHDEDGSLAITNIPSENLWKGLPKHCKNFEKDLPIFKLKEVRGHLRNYVGQMCDMYLTQSAGHNVGIKLTLDEIRREVLYLNTIQEKLDQSDKKKLNNYLKNLD
ncbi:hypothetical protein [Chryseobacterium sp. T16E-39]|uniref:hypothetical protein n=1 Tax=Chryseobacterium sp. T16E-39 TaxID=2015076 RepID=UPI0012F9ED1F|nr:hypothetical protein [Chryseobacterium sp. T16E-39]